VTLEEGASRSARAADAAARTALALAGEGDVAVIGGAAIYDVFMAHADRIELTEIHAEFDGDTFMKPPGPEWTICGREDFAADGDIPAYSFVTLERAA